MYIVENLEQDTEYVIRVAAVTKAGSGKGSPILIFSVAAAQENFVNIIKLSSFFVGPWSSEFVGRTLASSPTTLHSTLLWSGPDGLLQTDLTGDNLQTLIHR